MGNMMEQRAAFKSMTESTKPDWDIIVARHQPFAADLSNRVIGHLKLLGGDTGGFAGDRLQHSLLTATLAHKGGEDEEYVVCAPLEFFEPMVHRAFATPRNSIYRDTCHT